MLLTIISVNRYTYSILTGFGLYDSIAAVSDIQFNDIVRYDISVEYKGDLAASENAALLELIGEEGTDHISPVQRERPAPFRAGRQADRGERERRPLRRSGTATRSPTTSPCTRARVRKRSTSARAAASSSRKTSPSSTASRRAIRSPAARVRNRCPCAWTPSARTTRAATPTSRRKVMKRCSAKCRPPTPSSSRRMSRRTMRTRCAPSMRATRRRDGTADAVAVSAIEFTQTSADTYGGLESDDGADHRCARRQRGRARGDRLIQPSPTSTSTSDGARSRRCACSATARRRSRATSTARARS